MFSEKKQKMFSEKKTEECFAKRTDVKIDHNVDFVANTASNGAFRVIFDNNSVTLVFTRNPKEAANIDTAYRRFHAKNVGINDVLEQNRNVVALWKYHAGVIHEADLTDCLK